MNKKNRNTYSPLSYKGEGLGAAFTLVEIMMWVLIFSLVIIWGFKAYTWVLIWKIKLIESTDIQKEAFYFSEKFFEEIKRWGTIDYEEYFNRKVVWTGTTNGYYNIQTWFWNFWKWWSVWTAVYWTNSFYYCRSGNGLGNKMTGTWCVWNNILNSVDDVDWKPQRFWQYALQFIDYNSNYDADGWVPWDEDWDWNIIWDDDDEYLWEWPEAFSGAQVKEIYLISANWKNRTLFRWDIKDDPNADDVSHPCDMSTWSGGCLSTIKFLKLEWKDWWLNHVKSWTGLYDGIVDTWVIDSNFSWGASIIAGWWTIDDYWVWLFWDNINVSDVKFFAYPNKDLELAWKDATETTNIAPYIRIQMTLQPSYRARRWIKGKIPKIKINTTISLTDIYSR